MGQAGREVAQAAMPGFVAMHSSTRGAWGWSGKLQPRQPLKTLSYFPRNLWLGFHCMCKAEGRPGIKPPTEGPKSAPGSPGGAGP